MSAVAVLDEYLDGLLAPEVPVAPAMAAAVAVAAPAAVARTAPAPAAPAPARRPVGTVPLPPSVPPPAPADATPELPVRHRRAADRSSRWLRLRCAGQAYGLELLKVQEVVLPTPLLPLRGTAPAMLGVMNLRGQVVPVMDLGVHLGQAPQPVTVATRIVVLEEKGETLGLRVTAVDDVVNLTEQQVEAPESTRAGRIHSDLFRGIARLSADPVILLDASRLLQPAGA
ncbi:chemotaxis protein CheW [Pseudoxanthomonas suwonensis]|uniref:chemotaxis protein CheW n=1 Tax=Pseudoxanthomonas suwonensis TaxID=314722 RepID=UPI000696C1EE